MSVKTRCSGGGAAFLLPVICVALRVTVCLLKEQEESGAPSLQVFLQQGALAATSSPQERVVTSLFSTASHMLHRPPQICDSGSVGVLLSFGYLTLPSSLYGRDSSEGIATRYGLEGPGVESRSGARFSATAQTGPGAEVWS